VLDAPQVFKDARKQAYLNPEGRDRPLKSPLPHGTLVKARAWRNARLRERLAAHDVAGILLYDPVNIRYAVDSSNMQVWTLHNATRYLLLLASGPTVLFEYKGCEHLADELELIDEIRPAVTWLYMTAAENAPARARLWAGELAELVRLHGGGNLRLAVDKVEPTGLDALRAEGIEVVEGQELTERARAVKSPEEIELMRWTIRVCEAGMAGIYEESEPGRTERELWAILHHENARSGGDWLESKLLSAGPRTNPWYQECSDRVVGRGEMIAFDTDMIGPYGYCADLSRSWTCGHVKMTPTQARLYRTALDQIAHNTALLRPGLSFAEFNERSWRIPEKHRPWRYSLAIHGVGMVDEWPVIPLHTDFSADAEGCAVAMAGVFEPGMTVCVESLIAEAGSESIKLETQVLITETGAERLDGFPWEDP
jgi:Xaa-Pro aminopeptidase